MLAPRPFGQTGLAISPLGLGTVKLGRNTGLRFAPFDLPDDRAAANLIALAADLGINLLDTAPAYGTSEERLGALLHGQRERWVITTKAGEIFDPAAVTSTYDFSPAHVRFSVERSLKRLGTDRLDIVLIHSDGSDAAVIAAGALDALAALKAEGKIRAIGISSKTVEGGLFSIEHGDCAMVTHNLAYRDEQPVIARAAALGKAVLVKKPLASGTATVEESFRHIFAEPGVGAAVVGTINPEHLKANAAACARAIASA